MIDKDKFDEIASKKGKLYYGTSLDDIRELDFSNEKYTFEFLFNNARAIFDAKGVIKCFADTCFDSKEQAIWELTTRAYTVEIFEPPIWEDFLQSEEYIFWTKKHKQTHIMTLGAKYLVVETDFERFYTGDLTKENYIKACTIARKLFLGESIEDENKGENK